MTLWQFVVLIFGLNVLTFGNGPVLIPPLQANLVDQRGILTNDQLLYAFTIARVTPGQANVYVAAIGYMLYGLGGALLATFAILVPGYAMLPLLRGYERVRASRLVSSFTRGLTATSVGLIFAATVQIARSSLTSPIAWVVFALAFVMAHVLKWNPIVSLVAASAIGVLLRLLA